MTTLSFDFNDHQFKEKDKKVTMKAVGATLMEDRFGNKNSAARILGNPYSYLNLGTSPLLKPTCGSISMWINIQEKVYAGKGGECNPFLLIHNGPGEDFNEAISLGCTWQTGLLGAKARLDSVQTVCIMSRDTIVLTEWYHLLITWNDDEFAFYINGQLSQTAKKGFRTRFLETDSVMVGRLTGIKNVRYTHAIVDDIRFYHRVLNAGEVEELYNEPNPNRFKNIMSEVLKYGALLLLMVAIVVFIQIRNRKNLKKQREFFELNHKVKELEIKVIKAQMNPHFVANCLAAIQNLIYTNQVAKAGQYLAKFSFFLRQVLDYSDKTYIRLSEEIMILKLYVELEQLRFNDNFTLECNIEEAIDTKRIMIPSLITQTFVENAIWHGLLPLENRDPKLQVNIFSKKKTLFIEIIDNGVGRSNAKTVEGKNSRGMKLAGDKIESLNRRRNSDDFKLEIVDLFDDQKNPCGTKITIQINDFTLEE